MKRLIALLAASAVLALPAFAQNGFDAYNIPTTVFLMGSTNSGAATNLTVDTHGFEGVGKIDLCVVTNSLDLGGAITVLFEGGENPTNGSSGWSSLTYSKATQTAVIYTNLYAAGSLKATNQYLLPGVLTTPTAATSGWSTPYVLREPFTNTGAITVTPGTPISIGYMIGDAPRYLRVRLTSAAATNYTVVGFLTARKQQYP